MKMTRIAAAAGGERVNEGVRREAILDALPIAAASVSLQGGRLISHACNARFERVADRDGVLAEATRLLTSRGGSPNFAWDEAGIGGRNFEVHLEPTCGAYPAQYLLTLIDRTAEVGTVRSLRFEMLHDSLTGLPNRLAFVEAIDRAILAGADGRQFAVVALDLTRFGRINEGVGALAGDELIITVARRLLAAASATDMIARLAGDEFAILVELRDGPGDALHVARRLEHALATPLHLSDLEIRIDCAIGCAIYQDGVSSADDIVRNAQFAMKRAKESHRIEVYQPGEASAARNRFSLETELRRAIERDQIDVAFQPLVDLGDGRMVGCEALARWANRERGFVSPAEFINVAEESGLIVPLGRWMLDRVAGTIGEWSRASGRSLPFYVGVNVSPVQLQRDSIVTAVADTLAAHRLAGASLTLELTESSIVADPQRAAGVLTSIRALGCLIAMDDFGTGYSNLASLRRLPIDILKIDQIFVRNILDDAEAGAIVRAILGLAGALGLTTVAEGIETAAVADALQGFGCQVGQGYHFARPLAADELLAFYRACDAA